jgi:dissimilatory sulfite reductase (desulfoviridin) alpha/beta subunit
MTLKEKLCEPFGGLKTETVNELEVIADEYAVDFAEWVDDKGLEVVLNQKPKNTKELLEIYKIHKEL